MRSYLHKVAKLPEEKLGAVALSGDEELQCCGAAGKTTLNLARFTFKVPHTCALDHWVDSFGLEALKQEVCPTQKVGGEVTCLINLSQCERTAASGKWPSLSGQRVTSNCSKNT